VEDYLAIISGTDYRLRDHDKIVDWFISTGYLPTVTSQDGARDVAMFASGAAKYMTHCCYGKYIGELGVHSNEALYASLGYAHTELCPILADHFDWPSLAETNTHISRKLAHLSENVSRVTEIFPPYRNQHLSWNSHVERTPTT
jgi:hypothetical protein